LAADVDRLKAIVDRLAPLSTTVSGDLIRSQNWNALVLAVMDLARAILAEGPVTVPPHEHVGQVKAEWLDARLSTTIQRGPLADPDAAARLTVAEHSVTTVDGRVNGLASDLTQLRLRLNEVVARDLERESQVSTLGLRVSGVNDARDDVQALRTTLTSVQAALGTALAVAQQLTVDGTAVNIGAWGNRLSDLEKFRDGLREPDGNLLDASRLRADLQAATATLVSKEQLTAVLAGHATVLSAEQVASISDGIAASIRKDIGVQFTQLGDAIRTETQQRLNGIHDVVSSAVANAVPSLGDAVLAKLRPELSSAISASSSDLQALVDRRLTESSTALKTDFDTKLARLRGDVSGVITKEVGKQLAIELQPVNTSITDLTAKSAASSAAIADLTSKTDANAGALTTLNASVNTVGERIDSVAAAEGRARLALEKSLRTEITKVKFPASPP